MASFLLDPAADIASLRDLHTELSKSILGRGRTRAIDLELSSDARPGHLVLQLLASVAATTPAAGRKVAFGPRAAAEIARMDIQREERA